MNGEELFDQFHTAHILGPWDDQSSDIQQAWDNLARDATFHIDDARRRRASDDGVFYSGNRHYGRRIDTIELPDDDA